jgi:hypothetical protein
MCDNADAQGYNSVSKFITDSILKNCKHGIKKEHIERAQAAPRRKFYHYWFCGPKRAFNIKLNKWENTGWGYRQFLKRDESEVAEFNFVQQKPYTVIRAVDPDQWDYVSGIFQDPGEEKEAERLYKKYMLHVKGDGEEIIKLLLDKQDEFKAYEPGEEYPEPDPNLPAGDEDWMEEAASTPPKSKSDGVVKTVLREGVDPEEFAKLQKEAADGNE